MIEQIKKLMHNTSDLKIRTLKNNINIIYLESITNSLTISDVLIKNIINNYEHNDLKNFIPNVNTIEIQIKDTPYYLTCGFAIVIYNNKLLAIETRLYLDRSISESSGETVIRGPKDSFNENYLNNIGLIRKRIKNEELTINTYTIGKQTNTNVSIIYMNNLVDKNKLKMLEQKIKNIKIDSIIDSGYIRKSLNQEFCTFPKVLSTERPDLTCINLLKGRIAIIVENSPFALILPFSFFEFFNNPEDKYELTINSIFTKIIRFFAFIITLYTPAMYIAVTTYNKDIIPLQLLISLFGQVRMLPFSIIVEIITLVTLFEILREGDIRVPSKMGSSLSIVGGLILGDAAVSAGIASPIAVIIVAITSISSLLFSDIDFINGLRTWRYIFIFASSFLGITGIFITSIILFIHLNSLSTLKSNYFWGIK